VDFSARNIIRRSERAMETAVFDVSNQILKDSNYFCKEDTGTLKDSAISNSLPEKGIVRWVTPYAAKQYDYPFAYKDKNPNARGAWFEAARDMWEDQWTEVFERSYNSHFH
jgi:hypothetical protein